MLKTVNNPNPSSKRTKFTEQILRRLRDKFADAPSGLQLTKACACRKLSAHL